MLAEVGDGETISGYARKAVAESLHAGMMSATDGRFDPKAGATRADVAKLIFELMVRMGDL